MDGERKDAGESTSAWGFEAMPADVLIQMGRSLTDGMCICSSDGLIKYANGPMSQILKTGEQEVRGKKLVDFVSAEDQPEFLSHFTGRSESLQLRIVGKGGKVRWARLNFLPATGKAGDGDFIIVLAQDIDAQRAAHEAKAYLASIIESSDDAIVGKTLQGIVTSWNRGAERVFGYTAAEMIGSPIAKIIPDDRLQEETTILSTISRGERVDHFQTKRRTKSGKLIDVSVTVSPIRNPDGKIIGASKVARDVSVQLQAHESETATLEQLVRERTVELQAALHDMESFTYSVSHDLRGPLRSIIATSRVLEEDFGAQVPEEAKAMLMRQATAARRLADLIEDLLKLSRIGRQSLDIQIVDLSQLAAEVAEEVKEHHPESKPEIKIQPGIVVNSDPVLLKLALQNLIENSVKFTKPNNQAVIEVGCAKHVVFVKDNGIGFDQEYAQKIFLPFERLHRDTEYPGTGIGLANVRRVVERHGGRVWAESKEGEGATFYLDLRRFVG